MLSNENTEFSWSPNCCCKGLGLPQGLSLGLELPSVEIIRPPAFLVFVWKNKVKVGVEPVIWRVEKVAHRVCVFSSRSRATVYKIDVDPAYTMYRVIWLHSNVTTQAFEGRLRFGTFDNKMCMPGITYTPSNLCKEWYCLMRSVFTAVAAAQYWDV